MKNVLLVEYNRHTVPAILNETDWNISVLIVPRKQNKILYEDEARIGKIYTQEDFFLNEDYSFFEYKDLDFLWKAQLKVENFHRRFNNDYQDAKYSYYRGLSLVKKIYSENKIDIVIVSGYNEGRAADRLITEFAVYKNIPSYNIEPMLFQKDLVFDNINNKILCNRNVGKIDITESLFYKTDFPVDEETFRIMHPNIDPNGYINKIRKFIYKIGGQILVDTFACIYEGSLRTDFAGYNYFNRLKNIYEAKIIERYIKKKSKEPMYDEKFVFFSLHFEPESVITGRSIMDSQLFALKLLAKTIPKDWKIYVKEHPHQYLINKQRLYNFHVAAFKTKRFFKEIINEENVVLIDYKTPSKILIDNSIAVASMSGTVTMEAIEADKPVLVFAGDRTIYRFIDSVFNIHSYKDCVSAIDDIMQKKIVHNHEKIKEIINKYLVDKSGVGYRRAIKTISANVE